MEFRQGFGDRPKRRGRGKKSMGISRFADTFLTSVGRLLDEKGDHRKYREVNWLVKESLNAGTGMLK